jgi:hypothetical protein
LWPQPIGQELRRRRIFREERRVRWLTRRGGGQVTTPGGTAFPPVVEPLLARCEESRLFPMRRKANGPPGAERPPVSLLSELVVGAAIPAREEGRMGER